MVLRLGSSGTEVALWQRVIGVTADGKFGPKTEAATKAWQAARGLTPDGVVGPKTLAAAQPPRAPQGELIRPAVKAAFLKFTGELEGVVPWLYLDKLGLVTVAYGNLVDPIEYALSLPFVHPDGRKASRDEIAAAWRNVKSRQELAIQGYRVAGRHTSIRLTPDGIQQVVWGKLDEMVGQHLVKRYTAFPTWCSDAQLATISMSWACGPAFRTKGFTALDRALIDGDFDTASKRCEMNADGPDRIRGTADDNGGLRPRNKANKILYANAAKVVAWKLDPEELHWPTELKELEDVK